MASYAVHCAAYPRALHSFPTRRSSDLFLQANYNFVSANYFQTFGLRITRGRGFSAQEEQANAPVVVMRRPNVRSEEHTSELQSLRHLVCRLLLEKKKTMRESTLVRRTE